MLHPQYAANASLRQSGDMLAERKCFQTERSPMTRTELVEILVESALDTHSARGLLMHGCRGFLTMRDDELIEEFGSINTEKEIHLTSDPKKQYVLYYMQGMDDEGVQMFLSVHGDWTEHYTLARRWEDRETILRHASPYLEHGVPGAYVAWRVRILEVDRV